MGNILFLHAMPNKAALFRESQSILLLDLSCRIYYTSMNQEQLQENRNQRADSKEAQDNELDKDLDRYSVKLIKVVGVAGVVIGLAILVAFWYWVFMKLF